ncbi:2-thiouracil desulfurase family protein, partial [Thiolapillus sp.]
MSKPRVGVSACLLGQAVRYDGASRPHAWIREVLPRHAQVLPFCPESEAGLETPRPAVRLVKSEGGNIHVLGV